MGKVQIGTYARRNDDGSFKAAQPIYQETEERDGVTFPAQDYEEVSEMFYKIMRNAKIIKRRMKNE